MVLPRSGLFGEADERFDEEVEAFIIINATFRSYCLVGN